MINATRTAATKGSIWILIATVIAGCGSTLKVQEEKTPRCDPCAPGFRESNCRQDVPGVPFYRKRARRRQETERQEVALLVEVTISAFDKDAKPAGAETRKVLVAESVKNREELAKIATTYAMNPSLAVTDTLAALDRYQQGQSELLANRIVVDSVIDTSKVYYLNGAHPLVGSGMVSVDLATDGTLSKASASVDERTFSTILSAIPVSEILKAALIPRVAAVRTAGTPYWEVGVAVQRQVLAVHRYRKELFGCDPLGPPLDDPLAQGVEYERGTPSAPAGKTPITFEGSGSATLSK